MKGILYSDASWCPMSDAGGWGIWLEIEGRDEPIKKGGQLKERIKSSTEAEMRAMLNGLVIARRFGVKRALCRVDNMNIVRAVLQEGRGRYKKIVAYHFERLGLTDGLDELRIAYIPAHTGSQKPEHVAHDWCDEMARRSMLAAREVHVT